MSEHPQCKYPEFKKCDANAMCEFLAARITGNGGGGRGFHAICTADLNAPPGGPVTFQGVAFKTKAEDNGLMLNFCPFCGGKPGQMAQPKEPSSPAEDVQTQPGKDTVETT